jgi:choline dehydrogenase-like flavoprotein
MLIDARTLPSDEPIETDVCIVGAGPAGITMAREWIGRDFRVCLLESGGLELDPATQTLSQGKIISRDRYPKDEMEAGRQRKFGGASNLWHINLGDITGVRHTPMDPIDFIERDCLPYSGWAFGFADLEPYYHRAHQVCQLGPFAYDAASWADAETPPLPLKGDRLITTLFQFGPRDIFPNQYRDEICGAENITLYTYANVVQIETNDTASSVTRLKVACLDGKTFGVTAKLYVLAMGGIENARLLLNSNQVQTTGLGNQNDLVGRFYMDHPGFRIGDFFPNSRQLFQSTALYDLRRVNGTAVAGKLSLTPETLEQEQMLNTSIWLFPRPKGHNSKAVESLRTLLTALRQGKLPKQAATHINQALAGMDEIAAVTYRTLTKQQPLLVDAGCGGWSRYVDRTQRYDYFEVAVQVEQAPHPDNRLVLSQECDRLGLRKAELHWRWSDIDLRSIRRTCEILKEELATAGLGDFQVAPESEMLSKLYSAHHHIGTTRMHVDPKQGVVNENCQVHGIPNLLITGSSIFPTGGYANPTLTIVALAIRMADSIPSLL